MAADDAVAAAPVAASDADPTAPQSPIEMGRQIEQDLDSKTTLPVETRDCWLHGMYKELPGGARFEIEMRYCSIGWSAGKLRRHERPRLEPDRRLVSVMIRHGQRGFGGDVARTATPG